MWKTTYSEPPTISKISNGWQVNHQVTLEEKDKDGETQYQHETVFYETYEEAKAFRDEREAAYDWDAN